METNFVSYSSSIGRLELRVCFKVKYCHKVFAVEQVKSRCREILLAAAEKHGIAVKEIGFDQDRAHMVVQMPPTMSVSGMAKILKGTSGKKLLEEFPYMKRACFRGSGLWSPVVYFDSVGRDPEQISSYVRNQGVNNTTGL